jgi:hypothetical protein
MVVMMVVFGGIFVSNSSADSLNDSNDSDDDDSISRCRCNITQSLING